MTDLTPGERRALRMMDCPEGASVKEIWPKGVGRMPSIVKRDLARFTGEHRNGSPVYVLTPAGRARLAALTKGQSHDE